MRSGRVAVERRLEVALEPHALRGARPGYGASLDSQIAGCVEAGNTGALGNHELDTRVDPACGAGARDRGHVGAAAGDQDREPQRVTAGVTRR